MRSNKLASIALAIVMSAPAYATEAGAPEAEQGFGVTLSNQELDSERGRNTLTIIEKDMDAGLHDNAAIANVTGSNFIAGDALNNATGIPMVVQNTGNNVIIQNSTILNLQIK
jgi:hypothetical protein